MSMPIKGISVILYEKVSTGVDDFNRPTYTEIPVQIDNVVVGTPSTTDAINDLDLTGKKISYILAIPKDDTHQWEDSMVEFYDEKWHTVGFAKEYMPGFMGDSFPWNKLISVERYPDGSDQV